MDKKITRLVVRPRYRTDTNRRSGPGRFAASTPVWHSPIPPRPSSSNPQREPAGRFREFIPIATRTGVDAPATGWTRRWRGGRAGDGVRRHRALLCRNDRAEGVCAFNGRRAQEEPDDAWNAQISPGPAPVGPRLESQRKVRVRPRTGWFYCLAQTSRTRKRGRSLGRKKHELRCHIGFWTGDRNFRWIFISQTIHP